MKKLLFLLLAVAPAITFAADETLSSNLSTLKQWIAEEEHAKTHIADLQLQLDKLKALTAPTTEQKIEMLSLSHQIQEETIWLSNTERKAALAKKLQTSLATDPANVTEQVRLIRQVDTAFFTSSQALNNANLVLDFIGPSLTDAQVNQTLHKNLAGLNKILEPTNKIHLPGPQKRYVEDQIQFYTQIIQELGPNDSNRATLISTLQTQVATATKQIGSLIQLQEKLDQPLNSQELSSVSTQFSSLISSNEIALPHLDKHTKVLLEKNDDITEIEFFNSVK